MRIGWKTSKKERISYYIGDNAKTLEGSLVQAFMTTFLLLSGVNLVAVATVTLVVKIIDALDDVLFGYFVDKLNPAQVKFLAKLAGNGKYLPWYRLTFWMFPLATVLLFRMPQETSDWVKIAYFGVFYLLYDICFTIVDVPMNSAVMTITDSPEERNAIITNKAIITVVMSLIAAPLMNLLISEYVGMSISNVVLVMSIVFLAMMLPMVFVTKEHNAEIDPANEEKYTVKDMVQNVKGNKYLLLLFVSGIIYSCLKASDSISLFASYYLYGNSQILAIAAIAIIVPTLVMQKFAEAWCRKHENYKVCLIAQGTQLALRLLIFVLGYRNVYVHIVLLATAALPSITHHMATQYMMLDCIEYGKFKSGKECAGIVFAINSFITKVSASVASTLCLLVLSFFGWVTIQAESFAEIAEKGITQPASALSGLWFVYAGFFMLGTGLSLIPLFFYRLKNKDVKLISLANGGEISREEALSQLSQTY
jgi:Na+/melibiose symporter-like transporter